jgi:AraC family transcriptional activator of pobA
MPRRATRSPELALDRLPGGVPSVQVVLIEQDSRHPSAGWSPRQPHRHDYHELIWTRAGNGHHLIDGEITPVQPNTVTVIARGQVHVFERAAGLHGAVVRFADELLHGDPAGRANPGWLLAGRSVRTIAVPSGDIARLEGVIAALAAEAARPPDSRTVDLERHLLSTALLWLERWYDDGHIEHRAADDSDLQLYRRFADVLERDFARHRDVRHYAEQLRVPQAVLSRSLAALTGRGTKELITERRMLEAARLLRFTDMSVGEVAFRSGFPDPLYFSRAFKRRYGEAPMAYRERVRGRGVE